MIIENDRKIIIGGNFTENAAPAAEVTDDPKKLVYDICNTITEGGYNAVSQLMGYLISEDPAHISNYRNARTLIGRIDRDELLQDMIRTYLDALKLEYGEENTQDDD